MDGENLMNGAHISSNKKSRKNWSTSFPRCYRCGGPAQILEAGSWIPCKCPDLSPDLEELRAQYLY